MSAAIHRPAGRGSAGAPRKVVRIALPFVRPEEADALLKSAGAHALLVLAFLLGGWLLRSRLPPMQSTRVRLVGALEMPRASPAPSRPAATTPRPEPRPAPRPEPEEAQAPPTPAEEAPGVEPRVEPRVEEPEPPKPAPKPRPKPEPATAASASPDETSAPAGPPGPPAAMASAGGVAASVDGGADGLPDFYLDQIVRKVSLKWLKPVTGLPPEPTLVYFEINAAGRITTPRLERASGSALYDRAALRAVELAAPFGPLPKSRTSGILKVHFQFTP